MAQSKLCKSCGETKPMTSEHYFADLKRGGVQPTCKPCRAAARRALYHRNIVQPREASRELLPEGVKRCRDCDDVKVLAHFFSAPECRKGVRPECKECTLKHQSLAWRRMNPNKRRQRTTPFLPGETKRCGHCGLEKAANLKEFGENRRTPHGLSSPCRECTRVRSLELSKRPDQREKRRAAKLNRQARLRGATGYVGPKLINGMLAKQDYCCFWCSEVLMKYHVDHVVPVSRGGTHEPINLVVTCPTCNLRKNDRLPWEWLPAQYPQSLFHDLLAKLAEQGGELLLGERYDRRIRKPTGRVPPTRQVETGHPQTSTRRLGAHA